MWNDISKYIDQYKDIYGKELYLKRILSSNIFFSSLGNPNSKIVFLEEDNKSITESLRNKSDKLFDKILSAVNLNREKIYLLKIKKTDLHPKYITSHLKEKNFKLIVCLGNNIREIFFSNNNNSLNFKNRILKYEDFDIIQTFHPIELLDEPKLKRSVWEDFKLIKSKYL